MQTKTKYILESDNKEEQDFARKLYIKYLQNKLNPQPTFEADVKIDNVHYVVVIERATDKMLSYRAAQW